MKKITLTLNILLAFFAFCSFKPIRVKEHINKHSIFMNVENITFRKDSTFHLDKTYFDVFLKKYPKYKNYLTATETLYKNRNYSTIWYDDRSIGELGHFLYNKAKLLAEDQDIKSDIPYLNDIDLIFNETADKKPSKKDSEILLTCMYIYYADKVYNGLDEKKVKELGWYLPKKEISYEKILDSLLITPTLINKDKSAFFSQYYKLQDALKKYRTIQRDYEWKRIDSASVYKEFNPNDSSITIAQIRNRLFIYGDLKEDSKKPIYDNELMAGVLNFKKRNGLTMNSTIEPQHISLMNTPISDLIRTLLVNMERCRWIPPILEKDKKYVMINIPSFHLIYVKDGKYRFESNVFVGTRMTETVIFSGKIERIVFSPYWNVPSSIVNNVLKFKASQDPNYLAENNLENNNGHYRQKPGPNNSLGLVKFMFPNPNDIYMHDTPDKSLFDSESRTFSHGCINVQKAKELAIVLLEDDPDWPVDKINKAMSGKVETPCVLKNKIPIYIGYYTAWVHDDGQISFYNDIYSRDERLAKTLHLD
ncbi:murein L,D-transpeptidase [Flavobacterium sp. 5]|uniref:L,D-transpeptidase family protein n=1 Tax=Flavobacterium sp. 5 TaxID=2035199 RepID=UPI000C2BAE0F|nr:L,D-transpeptidase family protein [Flavobacterium sp. 5]PKB17035.1 L,D-transpeptidase-like protein [Flavobacterium sp. 5]